MSRCWRIAKTDLIQHLAQRTAPPAKRMAVPPEKAGSSYHQRSIALDDEARYSALTKIPASTIMNGLAWSMLPPDGERVSEGNSTIQVKTLWRLAQTVIDFGAGQVRGFIGSVRAQS